MATLTIRDVKAMLRLSHELHEMPDRPAERGRRLLEAMCGLAKADGGAVTLLDAETREADATISHLTYDGARPIDGAAKELWPAALDRAVRLLRQRRLRGGRRGATGEAHDAHCLAAADRDGRATSSPAQAWLHSFLPLGAGRTVACLSLHRPARRPFRQRDCDLVHAFHTETSWIHRRAKSPAAPRQDGLTPRQWETLKHLLAGLSEKQIAETMRLSRNTVHHYVKALYRHFRVSARGELMSRWVGRNDE